MISHAYTHIIRIAVTLQRLDRLIVRTEYVIYIALNQTPNSVQCNSVKRRTENKIVAVVIVSVGLTYG